MENAEIQNDAQAGHDKSVVSTRTSALCVYFGALCLVEFSKPKPTYVNPFGDELPRNAPTCPQCKKSETFESYNDQWLWCAGSECDFRIDNGHYLEIIEYFKSNQYEIDEFCNSVAIVSLGESSY